MPEEMIILKIDGAYLEWSLVDRMPTTFAMTRKQMLLYARLRYGLKVAGTFVAKLDRADRTGTSVGGWISIDRVLESNRAGYRGTHLTRKQVTAYFVHAPGASCFDPNRPPTGVAADPLYDHLYADTEPAWVKGNPRKPAAPKRDQTKRTQATVAANGMATVLDTQTMRFYTSTPTTSPTAPGANSLWTIVSNTTRNGTW